MAVLGFSSFLAFGLQLFSFGVFDVCYSPSIVFQCLCHHALYALYPFVVVVGHSVVLCTNIGVRAVGGDSSFAVIAIITSAQLAIID